eukprot:gene9785-7669_t
MSDPPKEQPKHLMVAAEVHGHKIEVAKKNLEYDEVDNCLFEADYTIAGSTGFLIWDGSFLCIELLKGELGELLKGKKVVELGSGTGLAGLCAAAAGAHVLLSDLPSVKWGILDDNINRNRRQLRSESSSSHDVDGNSWADSVPVGNGTATAMAIDWVMPMEPQVFLLKGISPSTDPAAAPTKPISCLLTFIDRAKTDGSSESFSTRADVVGVFEEKGCTATEYHACDVLLDGKMLQAVLLEIKLP